MQPNTNDAFSRNECREMKSNSKQSSGSSITFVGVVVALVKFVRLFRVFAESEQVSQARESAAVLQEVM
jgi:hypothetical protein